MLVILSSGLFGIFFGRLLAAVLDQTKQYGLSAWKIWLTWFSLGMLAGMIENFARSDNHLLAVVTVILALLLIYVAKDFDTISK